MKTVFAFVGTNRGITLNLTPKVLTKNLGTVQNSKPKHVACPKYAIYWNIPQVILRFKFSYLTIGKYRKDGRLEISDFLFLYLTISEYRKVRFMKVGEKNARHARFRPGCGCYYNSTSVKQAYLANIQ